MPEPLRHNPLLALGRALFAVAHDSACQRKQTVEASALVDASAGAQQTAALHRRFPDTLWLVFPVYRPRTNGVDRRGHLDDRGVHSNAPALAPQVSRLRSPLPRSLQVDLPVNSRIEYKYVILEEQVCPRSNWAPALVFDVTVALAVNCQLFAASHAMLCVRPAGLDEAGERGR